MIKINKNNPELKIIYKYIINIFLIIILNNNLIYILI